MQESEGDLVTRKETDVCICHSSSGYLGFLVLTRYPYSCTDFNDICVLLYGLGRYHIHFSEVSGKKQVSNTYTLKKLNK